MSRIITSSKASIRRSAGSRGPSRRRPPAACTIIARNYLSYARILAQSYHQHEPGGTFYLLVVDGLPADVDPGPGIKLISIDELKLSYFYEMCFKYNVTELATAVKPTLLSVIMSRYGQEQVIYFDPDILICRELTELKAIIERSPIVLLPHLLHPIPLDGYLPSEQDILKAGAYNLGCIALNKSPDSAAFLKWWEHRLRDGCQVDVARGLMTDQKWVDLVPGLFPSTAILRDPTYNVAYWNMHSRRLAQRGRRFVVNGRPLAFFHFSGFDPAIPQVFSKHQNRLKVSPRTPLARLLEAYVQLQEKNGFSQCRQWKYGYSHFDDGTEVHAVLRQIYLDLTSSEKKRFGDPFHVNGDQSFLRWALRPRTDNPLSVFLERIYRLRYDVSVAFPDIATSDRERFLNWARTQGSAEMGYSPSLVHGEAAAAAAPASASKANYSPVNGGPQQNKSVAGSGAAATPGVNFAGYLRNESGLGSAARGYLSALRHAGVPLALKDLSGLSISRSEDKSVEMVDAEHPHGINLICVNADQHFVVTEHVGREFFKDRYNIGIWAWELPRFPEKWHDRFGHYDEVWVGTSFIANTLAPVSPIPVVRIPPVLSGGTSGNGAAARKKLGIDANEFLFVFVFDFHSYFERKNPIAAIEAFRRAFEPRDRARLVIKCVNADSDKRGWAAMQERARKHNVSIHCGYWPAQDVQDLMAAADAYVSLHRSEGTGLTLSEAMALGKPVIATGWSGNMDFMTVSNSYPVRYELTPLRKDFGPYQSGEMWADPSIEHAAELMQHVASHRREAARRGQTAARHLAKHFCTTAVADLIRERLSAISHARGYKGQTFPPRPPAANLEWYQRLVGKVRDCVAASVPAGAIFAVISRGDDQLLKSDGRTGWHFPRTGDGIYAGYYPADGSAAIAHLEAVRTRGVQYLVLPKTGFWWLEHYADFKSHLEACYRRVSANDDCIIYKLADDREKAKQLVLRINYLLQAVEGLRESQQSAEQRVSDMGERLSKTTAAADARYGDLAGWVNARETDLNATTRKAEELDARLTKLADAVAQIEAAKQANEARAQSLHRELTVTARTMAEWTRERFQVNEQKMEQIASAIGVATARVVEEGKILDQTVALLGEAGHKLVSSDARLRSAIKTLQGEIAAVADRAEAKVADVAGRMEADSAARTAQWLQANARLVELARDLQNLRTDQTTQSSQTNARWSQSAEQIEAIRIAQAAQLAQAGGQGVELTEQVEAIKTAQIAETSKVNARLIEMARNIEVFQSVEPAHPATHVPPVAQVQPVDDPRVTALAETVARIDARMAARPYMGKDTFRALGDLDQPMGYANDPADVAAATEAKPRFSDLFRGPEDFIGQRQRIYLQFLQGRSRIVDIGCGRGEFLRELKGAGLPAVGLEIDPELVSRLREQGLSVNHCDGREYLRHQGDGSLDAIFLAHLLEQFTSEQIVEFVSNVRRVLQPGGVFIAETVNPESFEAMKTFHVDPAHRTPLFPQVMLYLCQSAGFSAARIFYPLGGGFTQRCYQTAGEYAVVAIA